MPKDLGLAHRTSSGLVEILDRVLDKGLVVAGDIQVMIADIELLTIRIRLIVCSLEKAEQLGIDWWRNDKHLSGAHRKSASAKGSNAGGGQRKRSSERRSARHGVVRAASGRVRSRRG